jgi:hypothetical protein
MSDENLVKEFLEFIVKEGVHIHETLRTLGSQGGVVFFLQSFEQWLGKRREKVEAGRTGAELAGIASPNNRMLKLPGVNVVETFVLNQNADASINERAKYSRIIRETYEYLAGQLQHT